MQLNMQRNLVEWNNSKSLIHKQNPGLSEHVLHPVLLYQVKEMLPEGSKMNCFIVSMFFWFYNQQLSALPFILFIGSKCPVFPAPDSLVHPKLNQQSKKMLCLLQAPCTSASSGSRGLSDAPLYFPPWGRVLKVWLYKGRNQIYPVNVNHSQCTVSNSLGMGSREIPADFLWCFKCSWKLSHWSSWELPLLLTAPYWLFKGWITVL